MRNETSNLRLREICFTPIAVPRCEVRPGKTIAFLDQFGFSTKILEKYQSHQYETKVGTVGGWKQQFSLRMVDIDGYYDIGENPDAFVNGHFDTFKDALNPDLPWKWRGVARENFPEIIDFVESQLPFRKITDVAIARSDDNLHPHRDQYYPSISKTQRINWEYEHREFEPLQYRICLDGTISGSTFVTNDYSVSSKKVFLNMPPDTNTFSLGATNSFHGSTIGNKKTLVCVFGFLDLERQKSLIEQSIKMYSDYVVSLSDL